MYLQRPNGEGAKAGNLNHARQYSSGEVILVLDAGRPPVLQVIMSVACMHAVLYVVVDAAMLAQQVVEVQTFNALFARCSACCVLFACAFNDTPQNNSSP